MRRSRPGFFFFQAEDGIRDHCVTGVQTCALPISETKVLAFWLILCAARMARTCPMDKKPVNLAVLFADITGSTRLYEKLGNARALECVGVCLNIMRESGLGCGGRVVQTIGDEFLCVFPAASAATQAAAEMQSRVEMQEPVSGQRLQIHIGLQFGPVL